jgi:serine/threonine protein kinase
LVVNDSLAGQKARCSACGQVVTIPVEAASAPSTLDASEAPTRPSASQLSTLRLGPPGSGRDPRLATLLAPPQSDDELGRLGNYRVLKVHGQGGMGIVFQGEDVKLKRQVAIKAMLPTVAARASAGPRFLREAQAMAAVEHDHIVRIYQVDEDRGVPFLAMELLKGETLEERLKREKKLPLAEAVRIGREMAEALAAAHATGLIHRDVKPTNTWLEAPRGRVKLLDFGLARAAAQDAGLTPEGMVVGTPAYVAPEQARGEAVDARSDLFSLGCVLYRMLTGQQPFQGKDIMATLLAVASHQPAPPARLDAGVPRELSELVMRLLEKAPARRPASAGEVAQALSMFGTAEPRQSRGLPGWGWVLAGGALLVVGLVVAVIVLTRNSTKQRAADDTPRPSDAVPKRPPTENTPQGWQRFTPPGGRFAVLLPGEPKETTTVSETERGPIKNHTFALEVGTSTYAVSWFDFPGIVPQGPQIKASLEGGQKGLLEKLGSVKVVKDRAISLDGFPGKEVVVENTDKRYTLTARLYLVRQRTYTLLASGPLGQADTPDVRHFFASFRLVREP